MNCLYCSNKTSVVNSRPQKSLNSTWRRRKCLNCNAVFTTTESADLASGLRIKLSNNKLQPFCHAKLLISIYKCCKHLNNPELTAQALANTTISKIITQNNTAIITATNLKSTVYNVLARYDKASSVQYAALHQLKYK